MEDSEENREFTDEERDDIEHFAERFKEIAQKFAVPRWYLENPEPENANKKGQPQKGNGLWNERKNT